MWCAEPARILREAGDSTPFCRASLTTQESPRPSVRRDRMERYPLTAIVSRPQDGVKEARQNGARSGVLSRIINACVRTPISSAKRSYP